MRCIRPFRYEFGEYGCGQCMPCRINKRREWTARIVLESRCHEANSFVTLTYAKEFYPGQLVPRDMKLFLRRLRRRVAPKQVRYFGVGEYGDKSLRAHYHIALFGLGMEAESDIRDSWCDADSGNMLGWVHVGDLNHDSAQYIAGYVCKKMTAKTDPRLEGKYPEFARMSLRPGVGRPACAVVAAALSGHSATVATCSLDVPGVVRIDGKKMPIGRYLKRGLREEMGWKAEAPQIARAARAIEYMAEDPAVRERKRESGNASALQRVKIGQQKRSL